MLISWAVGGLFAACAAYLVGKVALGLRSDYLAIATLGIAEIILAILKNENWLTRGVKNVTGLPRPIPDERVLQAAPWIGDLAARFGTDIRHRRRHRRPASATRCSSPPCSSRHPLARRAGAALALGPDDARHPRQPRRRRGDGQGRHPPAPAGLRPRLGGRRHRRRHAGDDRRPVHPGLLQPAALHLPDLGDGDRRRLRQQLGRGARRLPDLVRLDHGRARRHLADVDAHRRHDPGQLLADPPARRRPAPAPLPDGPDPAPGAALRPARPDPRTIGPGPQDQVSLRRPAGPARTAGARPVRTPRIKRLHRRLVPLGRLAAARLSAPRNAAPWRRPAAAPCGSASPPP